MLGGFIGEPRRFQQYAAKYVGISRRALPLSNSNQATGIAVGDFCFWGRIVWQWDFHLHASDRPFAADDAGSGSDRIFLRRRPGAGASCRKPRGAESRRYRIPHAEARTAGSRPPEKSDRRARCGLAAGWPPPTAYSCFLRPWLALRGCSFHRVPRFDLAATLALLVVCGVTPPAHHPFQLKSS